MTRFADSLIALRILKILATPFEKTDAFRLGIIDKNGTVLRKERDLRTAEEENAYTILHRMAWKIKKIFAKVPEDSRKLASFAAALFLIQECVDNGIELDEKALETDLRIIENDKYLMTEAQTLLTEASKTLGFSEYILVENEIANTTGNVEGLRTEPVITKKRQKKFIRRQGEVKCSTK